MIASSSAGARGVLAERAQAVLQSLLLVGCLVALALEERDHVSGVVGAAAAGAEQRGGGVGDVARSALECMGVAQRGDQSRVHAIDADAGADGHDRCRPRARQRRRRRHRCG